MLGSCAPTPPLIAVCVFVFASHVGFLADTVCPPIPQRISPYVPEPIKAGGAGLTFAKSKRTYTLTQVETDLREAKKGRLYASMSDPMASAAQPDPDSTVSER